MKNKFSKSWKASKIPAKQRKYRANAPLHIKQKLVSANLTKKLKEKYNRKNIPLKKGDSVKIMRGQFKKKHGKVNSINLKRSKVTIEGMQRTKNDGSQINVYFHPSNLQITELNLEDKKRKKSLERIKEKETKNAPQKK